MIIKLKLDIFHPPSSNLKSFKFLKVM